MGKARLLREHSTELPGQIRRRDQATVTCAGGEMTASCAGGQLRRFLIFGTVRGRQALSSRLPRSARLRFSFQRLAIIAVLGDKLPDLRVVGHCCFLLP